MKNAIISILICIAINTTSTLLANELAHRVNTIIEAPIKGKSQIETWRYENSCWKDVALVIKESCGEPLSTKPQLHRHYYKSHENWLACMAALSSYLSQHPHPKGLFLANIESITILELPTKVDMYCIVTNTAVTDTPPLFINQEGIAITPTEEPWKTLLTHSTVFSAIKETPKPTLTPQPSLTQQLMSLRQSKELQESRQRTQLTDARTAAGPVATT
ncbi:MAG: hypothetical protein WCJ17_04275, partial [bacterium]